MNKTQPISVDKAKKKNKQYIAVIQHRFSDSDVKLTHREIKKIFG